MKVKSGLTVLILLAMVSALFGACAQEAAPTAEAPKGEVVIGLLDDYSGPFAGQCILYRDGVEDCIRYINEEKGGIQGHPLKVIIVDYKMDASLAISGWNRLKNDGATIVIGSVASAATILHELTDRDHIPLLTGAGTFDRLFPKEPNFYFGTTLYGPGMYESMCRIIERDWAEKGETRSPKIGFDAPSIGTYPKLITKIAKMVTEKRGWEHIVTYTSLAPVDVTTQVLQMKQFGADYMHSQTTESGTVLWLKELDRQDFHPVFFGSNFLTSEEVWRSVGPLAAGTMGPQFHAAWTDTDLPMVSLLHELNAKWHPWETWEHRGYYTRGFAEFLVVAEATERAIKKVGYENLDGDAMKEAMETIRDFDPGIGIGYTWTPTDHTGMPGNRWYEWTEEGLVVPVGDWYIYDPLPEEQRTQAWWMAD